jgi:hypothetical protein
LSALMATEFTPSPGAVEARSVSGEPHSCERWLK